MKNLLLILFLLFVSIGGGLLVSRANLTKHDSNKIQVATSFYPLYFWASQIGGDKAEVKNITPAGAEPHDYDPSTKDIAEIENDNILILNGALETWGEKIKENLKGKDVVIVIAGEGLETRKIEEEGQTIQDPHIWLDPQLAKKEVQRIKAGFDKADPANSAYYETNAKNLELQLDQLDQKYKVGLQTCQTRDIITSHAAFGYLASRYSLNQITISGVSPDEEPSAQQLSEVADFAKKNNVKYIFFESLVSPKLAETIANEVGAQTLVLDPIEGISDDEIKQGKNYFTVMEANLKNLQRALSCNQ